MVLNWRKKLKDLIKAKTGKKVESDSSEDEKEEEDATPEVVEERDDELDEEMEIDDQLKALRDEEAKEARKKLKRARQEKAKLQKKLELKMVLPGDHIDVAEDGDLFKLKTIQNKKQLAAVEEIDLKDIDGELSSDEEEDDDETRRTRAVFDRNEQHDYGFSSDDEEEEEEEDWNEESDDDRPQPEKKENNNPRLVQLEDAATRSKRTTNLWFKKDSFGMLNDDDDEDVEIGQTVKRYKEKGGTVREKERQKKKKKTKETKLNDSDSDGDNEPDNEPEPEPPTQDEPRLKTVKDHMDSDLSDSSDYSSSESESELDDEPMPSHGEAKKARLNNMNTDGFEVVPANHPLKKQRLDAEGLALGAALAQSRKRRREVIESAYNRYTFDDQTLRLPDWFTQDESKNYFPQLPVTKDEVEEYKKREVGIDARPIKKIAEAKARKKRKMTKRLEKARKKAETISDNVDVTDKEKMQQIKGIYKKAGLLKKQQKKETTYVVAKKGIGRRVARPAGVKGKFKMVDPRMKKEGRQKKRMDMAKSKKGGKGGKGGKKHR